MSGSAAGAVLGTLALAGFAVVSVVLSVIDLRSHRLPDAIVLPSWAGALVLIGGAAWAHDEPAAAWRAALGGLVLFGAFVLARALSRGAVGGGDVKLAGLVGTMLGWAGWQTLAIGAGAAFVLAGAWAVALLLGRRATGSTRIAFGPFLVAGAWVGLLAALVG